MGDTQINKKVQGKSSFIGFILQPTRTFQQCSNYFLKFQILLKFQQKIQNLHQYRLMRKFLVYQQSFWTQLIMILSIKITIIDNLPIIGSEILIPLKAKAWLDLSERKMAGETIDSKNIKKHRNDIFRLYPLLPGTLSLDCPQEIKEDLRQFTEKISSEKEINLKDFGIGSQTLKQVIVNLKKLYNL